MYRGRVKGDFESEKDGVLEVKGGLNDRLCRMVWRD